MSNLGLKPNDGTEGKLISYLQTAIGELKRKVYELEQKVEMLEQSKHSH